MSTTDTDSIFGQAIDLSARFHKVMINTKMPSMTKTVKGLIAELEAKKGAAVGVSLKETGPKLYADSPQWAAVKKARNAVASTHQKLTSVWDQSGWRLLSTANWTEYHQKLVPLIAEFNKCADALAADFTAMVQEAEQRLGSLFAAEDYPRTPDEFRQCFKLIPNNEPVPKMDDAKRLSTVLPVAEIEAMQRDMQRSYQDNLERINTQNWEMLFNHTNKLANSLLSWSKGEQKSIKRTLLDEIEKACQFCTQFNASNDPRLASMVEDIRSSLLNVDIDDIRDKPEICASVIQSAQSTRDRAMASMNKMRGFCGTVN